MNNAFYRITLDVHSICSQTTLTARKGETGRTIIASLTENGRPYEITEGCNAEFVMIRPDGNKLKNECIIEGNTIKYNLTMMTTINVGAMECELRLTDAKGTLLTTPRFRLEVYATIYNTNDAVESETANLNTVKSANPAYAEVLMWSDGNPEGENRTGYFVTEDLDRAATMVKICNAESSVRGVSMAAPGFASNAPGDRFDENSYLRQQFCYVGLLGMTPVIDNGTCEVNRRCRPGDDGTAVPDDSGGGYMVVERLDETHVLILLEQSAEMMSQLERKVDKQLREAVQCFDATVGTEWEGKEPPYIQTIEVPGVLAKDRPKIWPVYDEDVTQAVAQKEAWAMVSDAKSEDGVITFRCLEDKPEKEIKIQIEVHR